MSQFERKLVRRFTKPLLYQLSRFGASTRYRRCLPHRVIVMKATLRILAVDDNPSIRGSMPFIFAPPHYEITSAPDGNDAMEKLDAKPDDYDVIIVDQKMPDLTGLDLVAEIRKRGFAGKIMVLSAHLSSEIREAYERMDVHLVLDKPFDIQELRLAVDRLAA